MIGERLGPYEIMASIGSGGMGEVWKARDTRLDRIVAIKKVKEQHSQRFKQEARSIAALNHPYICQLHDIGPNYLVLEYVEGKSLSSPLPEKEAMRLAIQIATALEAAHKKGIIHRDLKPSNIMVTDEGSVKLLDFGLAKLYEQDASISRLPTADMPQTQAGAILGTVAYMSPEQAQGQPADTRSDIFSFGLVLYEMLSGRKAFSGDSTPEIIAALLKDTPLPLQKSPQLEKIVRRCLERNPSERYQTMSEVKVALEKIGEEKASQSSIEPQQSIAVLPFVNMSDDKEQEYFSDGLAEEIINALTKIPHLKVIARTSSFSFRAKEVDIGQIRDRLKVRNILEGSVRKSGNRIRVTAQLIDTADESHLWSERYDREITDVFTIQDEISQAIADKLRLHLSGERSLVKRHTENVEAYSLYLKGRYYYYKFTPEGFTKSKEHYEQALAMDPSYALAWYGLAILYWGLGLWGHMPPKSANAQFRQAALNVLTLAENLPEAHVIMGLLRANEYNWKAAELEFLRALEMDPRSEEAWMHYIPFCLLPLRRLEEVIAATRKSLELDPLSPLLNVFLGNPYFWLGQYDRAIGQFSTALELDPNYWLAHYNLGHLYVHMDKMDEGIRSLEAAAQLSGNKAFVIGFLGYACARAGRTGEAQKLMEELKDLTRKTYVPPSSFAWMYLGMGEIDKGLDLLDRLVDEHDTTSWFFFYYPTCDSLRSYPRFKAFLRRMNLEP